MSTPTAYCLGTNCHKAIPRNHCHMLQLSTLQTRPTSATITHCFVNLIGYCFWFLAFHRWHHQQTGGLLRGGQPRGRGLGSCLWQQDGANRRSRQWTQELPGKMVSLVNNVKKQTTYNRFTRAEVDIEIIHKQGMLFIHFKNAMFVL